VNPLHLAMHKMRIRVFIRYLLLISGITERCFGKERVFLILKLYHLPNPKTIDYQYNSVKEGDFLSNISINSIAGSRTDIYARGYGIVSKRVMFDRRLSLTAKAIYAYICSYCNADNRAFPSRERTVSELGINKDTYYRHFAQLLNEGYIEKSRTKTDECRFANNIYTVVDTPKKGEGYGRIPKSVMVDRNLSVKAKGMYAYYVTFVTSVGESAFPSKSIAMYDLGIGSTVFERYNKELSDSGYADICRRMLSGRFSTNDVLLTEQKDSDNSRRERFLKLQKTDSEFTDSEKTDTEISDNKSTPEKENHDDKITRLNSREKEEKTDNSSSKFGNGVFADDENVIGYRRKRDLFRTLLGRQNDYKHFGEKQLERQDYIISELFKKGSVQPEWLADRELVKAAVEVLTDDELCGSREGYRRFPNGDWEWSAFCLYRDALISILSAGKPQMLGGRLVDSDEILEKLSQFVKVDCEGHVISLEELNGSTRDAYQFACENSTVRNPEAYMKSCLWRAMQHPTVMYDAEL